MTPKPDLLDASTISIIIPTWNSGGHIGHGLGVLETGKNQARLVESIFQLEDQKQAAFKKLFSDLGKRFEQSLALSKAKELLAQANQQFSQTKQELDQIKSSKAWKTALLIRKVRVILAPPNTWREKLTRSLLHFIRNK